MGELVQCSYCFEVYDSDESQCPNCLEFTCYNLNYDLGADR